MAFPFSISGQFVIPAGESAVQDAILRATDALREVSDSVGHSHDRVWSRPQLLALFSRQRGGRNPTFFFDRIDLQFRETGSEVEVTYHFAIRRFCAVIAGGAALLGVFAAAVGGGPWVSRLLRGALMAVVAWSFLFGMNYSFSAEAPDWLKRRLAE
jgi:hypothetical protein